MTERKWNTFYYNGNTWCGVVDSLDKFKEVLKAYNKARFALDHVLHARRYTGQPGRSIPDFGFYPPEYAGPQTLGEWLRENNVDLAAYGIVAK